MNMENPAACPPYPAERVVPSQQLRDRAQRLYMMGELNLAAQLLLELAARRPELGEDRGDALNG